MTTPTLTQAPCQCGDRAATECPGPWAPGCDLGANEAHVRVAPTAAGDALAAALAAPVEKAAPSDALSKIRGVQAFLESTWRTNSRDTTDWRDDVAIAIRTLQSLLGSLSAQQAAQPVALVPLTPSEKRRMWHSATDLHRAVSHFESYCQGIEDGEAHHGIKAGKDGAAA